MWIFEGCFIVVLIMLVLGLLCNMVFVSFICEGYILKFVWEFWLVSLCCGWWLMLCSVFVFYGDVEVYGGVVFGLF